MLEQLIEEKFKTDEKKANDYMVNIDYNDCDSEWWTGHTHGDSTASLTARYSELWGFLKYSSITNMGNLFRDKIMSNADLSNWKTTNCISMAGISGIFMSPSCAHIVSNSATSNL